MHHTFHLTTHLSTATACKAAACTLPLQAHPWWRGTTSLPAAHCASLLLLLLLLLLLPLPLPLLPLLLLLPLPLLLLSFILLGLDYPRSLCIYRCFLATDRGRCIGLRCCRLCCRHGHRCCIPLILLCLLLDAATNLGTAVTIAITSAQVQRWHQHWPCKACSPWETCYKDSKTLPAVMILSKHETAGSCVAALTLSAYACWAAISFPSPDGPSTTAANCGTASSTWSMANGDGAYVIPFEQPLRQRWPQSMARNTQMAQAAEAPQNGRSAMAAKTLLRYASTIPGRANSLPETRTINMHGRLKAFKLACGGGGAPDDAEELELVGQSQVSDRRLQQPGDEPIGAGAARAVRRQERQELGLQRGAGCCHLWPIANGQRCEALGPTGCMFRCWPLE